MREKKIKINFHFCAKWCSHFCTRGDIIHTSEMWNKSSPVNLQELQLSRCWSALVDGLVLCCSARASFPLHQGGEQQCYTSNVGAFLQDGPTSRLPAVLQESPHTTVYWSHYLPSQRHPVQHHSAGWDMQFLSHTEGCVMDCLCNLDLHCTLH